MVCVWGSLTGALAQAVNPTSESTIRVHGIVLNAITQSPLRRALVETIDQHMALMTDERGRVEFEVKPLRGRTSSNEAALVEK